jgi:hypothetical protein
LGASNAASSSAIASASDCAGIPKPVFLQRLGDYGVAVFDMTEEEFEREARLARTDL